MINIRIFDSDSKDKLGRAINKIFFNNEKAIIIKFIILKFYFLKIILIIEFIYMKQLIKIFLFLPLLN